MIGRSGTIKVKKDLPRAIYDSFKVPIATTTPTVTLSHFGLSVYFHFLAKNAVSLPLLYSDSISALYTADLPHFLVPIADEVCPAWLLWGGKANCNPRTLVCQKKTSFMAPLGWIGEWFLCCEKNKM